MKSVIAVLTAAAVSFGIVSITNTTTTAEATYGDTRNCVTMRELKKIRIGNTKARVHYVFDGAGRRTYFSSFGWEDRIYRFCGQSWDDPIRIDYINGRVATIDAWALIAELND